MELSTCSLPAIALYHVLFEFFISVCSFALKLLPLFVVVFWDSRLSYMPGFFGFLIPPPWLT